MYLSNYIHRQPNNIKIFSLFSTLPPNLNWIKSYNYAHHHLKINEKRRIRENEIHPKITASPSEHTFDAWAGFWAGVYNVPKCQSGLAIILELHTFCTQFSNRNNMFHVVYSIAIDLSRHSSSIIH